MHTPADLTTYLHQHIPLSAAMGAKARELGPQAVVLEAPLGPNLNHRSTVFGGSLTTLAILAAWSWLRVHFEGAEGLPTLVIQRESMAFLNPAVGTFTARCAAPPAPAVARFDRILARHGRARLELRAEVSCGDLAVGHFSGEFVALLPQS